MTKFGAVSILYPMLDLFPALLTTCTDLLTRFYGNLSFLADFFR